MDHDRQAVDQPVIGQERQSAFTPGPWTNNEYGTFVYSKHGNVCACGDPRASHLVGYTECEIGSDALNEAVANARLISAAPDLYAAIRNSDDAHWTPAMRAALAKAERPLTMDHFARHVSFIGPLYLVVRDFGKLGYESVTRPEDTREGIILDIASGQIDNVVAVIEVRLGELSVDITSDVMEQVEQRIAEREAA